MGPRELRAGYHIGLLYITRLAQQAIHEAGLDPLQLLTRHAHCDWGDLADEDRRLNDAALGSGERLLSRYNLPGNRGSVYIITEWDRSMTTILLVEEY